MFPENLFLVFETAPLMADDKPKLFQLKSLTPGVRLIADPMKDFNAFKQKGGLLFMVNEPSSKFNQFGLIPGGQPLPVINLGRQVRIAGLQFDADALAKWDVIFFP
jgi:hypothetical protein